MEVKCDSCGNVQDIDLKNCLECSEEIADKRHEVKDTKKSEPTTALKKPVLKRKTVGLRYITRIVFGFLIVISFFNSLLTNNRSSLGAGENSTEMMQQFAGKLFVLVLGVWLIDSGLKKRRALKEQLASG